MNESRASKFLFSAPITKRTMAASVPSAASAAVLQPSEKIPDSAVPVVGPNFEKPLSLQEFLGSYERIGFQANSLGKAINIINKMVRSATCHVSQGTDSTMASVNGDCLTIRSLQTKRRSIRILKFALRRNATSSSATPLI